MIERDSRIDRNVRFPGTFYFVEAYILASGDGIYVRQNSLCLDLYRLCQKRSEYRKNVMISFSILRNAEKIGGKRYASY